jgi:hypothetical protein
LDIKGSEAADSVKNYLQVTEPSAKREIREFVSSEDDLGPEMIMNIKWVEPYRYPSKALYFYLECLQDYRNKYHWQVIM